MMSVLGLPGRPPRDQLSLCGVVITGEPEAATEAYRHDYNLLLPQIVSPVALPSTALGCLQQSSLTSHLFIQQQLTYQLSHSVSVCSNTTVTTTVPPRTLTVGHHMETFRPLLSVLCRAGPSDEVQCPAVRCLVL